MFKNKKEKPQKGLVTIITTANNQFVKKLNQIHNQEILPDVIQRSKDDATKNLPSNDTKTSVHVEFLTARYNRLVVDYKSEAGINQQKYNANKEISQFIKLKNRLKEKLLECRNNLRIKSRVVEELKSSKNKIIDHKKAMVGIVLLSASEAIFASTSFQIFVQNLLFSLIIGLTFAVALYYSAVIGARMLKLARNRYEFAGIFFGILLVIGAVFYTLGYFRLVFLNQMADDTTLGYHLSPLQFMGIQLFFFSVAILLKFYFLPQKHELENYRKYKQAKEEVEKLSKQQKNLEDQIEELEKSLNNTLITRRTLISSAADVELKIQALYRDAYQAYVKTNLHHRSSGIPACFEQKNSLANLSLYFQDKSLLEFNEADLESDV